MGIYRVCTIKGPTCMDRVIFLKMYIMIYQALDLRNRINPRSKIKQNHKWVYF